MKWNDILKFDDDDDWTPESDKDYKQRMKERYEASLRDGGGVDENNPIHKTVEEIIKKHGYGAKAEKVIERLKLRIKWLKKNAEYGGRD